MYRFGSLAVPCAPVLDVNALYMQIYDVLNFSALVNA